MENYKSLFEEEELTLYNADKNCEHEIENASGGGIVCKKCKGWFCF